MNNFYSSQRVTFEQKQNPDWYKPVADHIIDLATSYNNNKDLVEKQLRYARGIVDTADILKELKKFSIDGSTVVLPKHIDEFEFITGIVERYIGEYIRNYSDFEVYNNDPETVMKRNQTLNAFLEDKIFDVVMDKFSELQQQQEQADQQAQQQGAQQAPQQSAPQLTEDDIKKIRKDFLDTWIDEKVIEYSNVIHLLNDITDAEIKYIKAFFYWFATEQVISYRRVIGNKVYKEIVSPVEYYRINGNNNMFIEDDPIGVRQDLITMDVLNSQHRNDLDAEDYQLILQMVDTGTQNGEYLYPNKILQSRQIEGSMASIGVPSIDGATDPVMFTTNGLIARSHIVFKSEEEIQILTYHADDGSIKTKEVDTDYELDPMIGDISLTEDYILKGYEMYRFGSGVTSIYTKPRYFEPQRVDINNSSDLKLPYNGITGILGDGHCNPIPSRIAPLQVIYKLYSIQLEKAISRYKNLVVIPEDLIEDSEETSRVEKLSIAKEDGFLFVTTDNVNLIQGIRSVYMSGLENFIKMISELKVEAKKEALEIASMNEQRYGDINSSAGKATTEYAITKATTASILLFEMFNKFRERDGLADIDASKLAWIDGIKGSFYNKQTNKTVYVDIPGEQHNASNIGITYKNGVLESEKKTQLANLALASAQNGNLTLAAEAIDSNSMASLKEIIKKVEEQKTALEQANMQYTEQAKKDIEQMKLQLEDMKEKSAERMNTESEQMETARLEYQMSIKMYEIQALSDNANGKSNDVELKQLKLGIEQRRLALDTLSAKQRGQEIAIRSRQQKNRQK